MVCCHSLLHSKNTSKSLYVTIRIIFLPQETFKAPGVGGCDNASEWVWISLWIRSVLQLQWNLLRSKLTVSRPLVVGGFECPLFSPFYFHAFTSHKGMRGSALYIYVRSSPSLELTMITTLLLSPLLLHLSPQLLLHLYQYPLSHLSRFLPVTLDDRCLPWLSGWNPPRATPYTAHPRSP